MKQVSLLVTQGPTRCAHLAPLLRRAGGQRPPGAVQLAKQPTPSHEARPQQWVARCRMPAGGTALLDNTLHSKGKTLLPSTFPWVKPLFHPSMKQGLVEIDTTVVAGQCGAYFSRAGYAELPRLRTRRTPHHERLVISACTRLS